VLLIGHATCLQRSIHKKTSVKLFICAAQQFSFMAQGDLAAALRGDRDSLAIRERLAKTDPW